MLTDHSSGWLTAANEFCRYESDLFNSMVYFTLETVEMTSTYILIAASQKSFTFAAGPVP
jgi:hypothetical protein